MPKATFTFPRDFRWGTATSSYPVEGNNTNSDWWLWEAESGRIRNGDRSGLACNWWENAEGDLDRAAEMGNNALRFSIEWSRVEPRPGEFDEDVLYRYREIVQAMLDRNLDPMVTLHHFTNPLWLVETGGWVEETVVAHFARYVRQVVKVLGDLVERWITIDEPMVYAVKGYLEGVFPPGVANSNQVSRVVFHMLRAHAAAYHTIHELQPLASVGIARHFRLFEPASSQSVLDRFAARNLDRVLFDRVNRALLTGRWGFPVGRGKIKGLARTMDFIGLNYHTRELVAFSPGEWGQGFAKRSFNPDGEMSDHNFGEIYPAGILKGIERAAAYSRPIFITENGLPDADDDQRPRFILAHLLQVWRALQENLPVMGYYHQSLVDSFEWDRGWTERFGLISVDTETQIRTWRQSGELYRQICQRGCIDWEMVHRWAPELLEYIFPG